MTPDRSSAWGAGDRVLHRFNPDLGPGSIEVVDGRTLVVRFPLDGTVLRIAADTDALERLVLRPGETAQVEGSGEQVEVAEVLDDHRYRLTDGRTLHGRELWPVERRDDLVERLARGDVDPVEDFANRLDGLHLNTVRQADGLGSFLGGRIRLFPHQLHVAERATRADPVRWLLADEVGLGKTVEACLILNRLIHTGQAERVLVVTPDSLAVQWLGELWRKYHQVFVLMDEERLEDVGKVYGAGFNPFDVHRRAIVSMDTLLERKELAAQAAETGLDVLIVDEAHHLRRPRGHPGNPAWRAVAPLAGVARHALLLTATPLEDDAFGFYRLLQLLRPDELTEENFEERIASGEPLPPCTSATRRADIGGLPPREHRPAEVDDGHPGWVSRQALEQFLRRAPVAGRLTSRDKLERIRRGLGAPAGLAPLLRGDETELRRLAAAAARTDPRVAWLADRLPAWRATGDKTLIFVADREALEPLKEVLERQGRVRLGVFHEDLSPGRRDIEVAQFRLPDGPSALVSTESGGEGRNFEFCRRLVLFDLPWDPMTVEQRIGRLDRIGRDRPVEIVTFRPPAGLGAEVADLMESFGLYREPLTGLSRHLENVERMVSQAAMDADGSLDESERRRLDDELAGARQHLRDAAARELHRDPYRPERAAAILARVPPELDDLTEDVITAACERFGFDVEEQRGAQTWSVEFGSRAVIDQLAGVPGGTRFLGSFSREAAVENESLDYFASGHPLVEGVLAELEDGPRGRVALLHRARASSTRTRGAGLLALYATGNGFQAVAVDTDGRSRPEWAALLVRRPLRTGRVRPDDWCGREGWSERIRAMARALPARAAPDALAFFVLGPLAR